MQEEKQNLPIEVLSAIPQKEKLFRPEVFNSIFFGDWIFFN
jgi:hypothetical protein